jgi:predicted nucleic acid-binding protein
MTHGAEEISTYDFKPSEKLFLDANIWLLVCGPPKSNDPKVSVYSEALKKILTAKSPIYIDVLIVSEFINVCARLEWNLIDSSKHGDFKQFRKSKLFKPVAQAIAANVKRVLQHCKRIANDFESVAIDTLIEEYAAGDSDFNDQIIAALCSRKGLKLVTDDGDFKGRGVPIITANKKLLT